MAVHDHGGTTLGESPNGASGRLLIVFDRMDLGTLVETRARALLPYQLAHRNGLGPDALGEKGAQCGLPSAVRTADEGEWPPGSQRRPSARGTRHLPSLPLKRLLGSSLGCAPRDTSYSDLRGTKGRTLRGIVIGRRLVFEEPLPEVSGVPPHFLGIVDSKVG